jgi:hypothetical protein
VIDAMIPVLASTKVWFASGVTDMRKGFNDQRMLVQDALEQIHSRAICLSFAGVAVIC